MPSHRVHRALDELLLGKEAQKYKFVHAIMDSTAGYHGSSHRRDLIHEPLVIFALTRGDPKALLVATMHSLLDRSATEAKRRIRESHNPIPKRRN